MVSEGLLAHQGGADTFPAVVFGAVAWGPVWGFERGAGAVQGADRCCSFTVFPDCLLACLRSSALVAELQLGLRLLILVLPLARPTGRTHELFALLLGLPVVLLQVLLLVLAHHDPERLPLVVHAVVRRPHVPFALFSPFARPPDAHDDAEEAKQAEEHAEQRHQVICGDTPRISETHPRPAASRTFLGRPSLTH